MEKPPVIEPPRKKRTIDKMGQFIISRGLCHISAVQFISGFHPEPRKGRVP